MKAIKLPLVERASTTRAFLLILGTCATAGAIWAQSAPQAEAPALVPAPAPIAPTPALPPVSAPGGVPAYPTPASPSAVPPGTPVPPAAPSGLPRGNGRADLPPPITALPGGPYIKVLPAPRTPPPMAGNIGTPVVSNESQLSQAIIEEETNPDPSIAKEAYKSLVQQFDQQRQGAAQAIFRLGECYRRLGRMEEARAQYGRIVREFVDFPELAQQSMRLLSETAKQISSPTTRIGDATPDVASSPADLKFISDMKSLVQEQVHVREQALNRAREQRKAGIAPASEVEEAEVRLLQLKERLLTLMNAEQMASDRNQPAARAVPAAPTSDVLVPRDPKVAQLDTELRSTLAKISELDIEKGKQTQLLEMLKRSNPESLPLSVVNDERYKEMKRAYEEALARSVGASDPKTAEDSVTTAVERIRTWVKQVLIPELNVAAEYRMEQLAELHGRADELNMKLEKIHEQEMVKSPAAARR